MPLDKVFEYGKNLQLGMSGSRRTHRFFGGLVIFTKDYLWLEVVLPLAPVIVEFLMKLAFSNLGKFELFEKPLAISAMMVPLISFIKTPNERAFIRWLYGMAIFWGLVLFVLAVVIASPAWSPNPSKSNDLIRCYRFGAIGVVFTLFIGILSGLWKTSVVHLFSRRDEQESLEPA